MNIDKTRILSSAEVRALTSRIRRLLGPEILGAASRRWSMADRIRFAAVAASCVQERERRGMTLKDAAGILKVPQYRLRAVETGSLSEIRLEVVTAYLAFLGLTSWSRRWARANPRLSRRLGIHSADR